MCADDFSHLLKLFDYRLKTFQNWKGPISPIELAQAGFYYLDTQDVVRCFQCSIEIYKWVPQDIPIIEHLKHSPNCNFARMMKTSLQNVKSPQCHHKQSKTFVKIGRAHV